MTYTYWPPAKNPNFKPIGGSSRNDCGETSQVYVHISFGVGAPNINCTLSEYACVRGLQRVYNNDCDASHKDNNHGGQLDLGTFVPPLGPDPEYNDRLFYLADPNPPLVGRNSHCSNGKNRFVPNLKNTKVLEEWVDEYYGEHHGFGGDDPWDVMPKGWTNWVEDWKVHEGRKKDCSGKGGIYDKKGGRGIMFAVVEVSVTLHTV
ncbi:hypothetical protein B0A48_02548 [Cryoendolithus antarcticus]|uniref:Uncharacterized protein n=1 Tax=Cryoendolithus antarcticus TaxID=1507870 RepID=A0A1V8TP40_9PEZI|nr:hypothetical protein B0A48_02548 [Cryoendolithus antarcticus]